ncbi:carbohydrate-binding protein [Bradyrhizobium daqingense]|uniref:carbohydrate-binding protein n=1 Tax=Bradyrhizobium daqingense TaxID=993502 RepID=UPI003834CDA5
MTALASYSTGLATVGAGGTTVTGTSTIWSGTNVKPGDIFQIGNFQSVISDVTDTTHLIIPPWGGGAQTGVAYTIWKVSPQRFAGSEAMATVNELVAAFNTSGYFVFVDIDETEPDPSLGDDGQYAFQPTTGKTWVKIAGVWTFLGIYKGFNLTGAWDSGTDYVVGDVVSLDGASYVCVLDHTNHTPPNTTYWQLLASKGDAGATGAKGDVAGIKLTYSTTTADADPGAGVFRLNNATPASATAAYIDNTQVGGASITAILDTWDDSTGTTKGYVRFEKTTDPTVWAQFRMTGSVVDGTGYRKLTLANGAGSGAFTNADTFAVTFSRAGDTGPGDVTAANNGSEFNAASFATTLSLIRYAAQTLTAAQKAQARANLDVLKKNYLLNSAMMVSQENGTTAGSAPGYFPVDQFAVNYGTTSAVYSAAQVASVTPGGSPNRLRVTVTTADAVLGGSDIVWIDQKIEGLRAGDLLYGSASAKTVTVQFGVKAPAGTYSVTFLNAAQNRSYVAEYTISGPEANTDVTKSVTIPGDQTGVWAKDNTVGLWIRWGLMAGQRLPASCR